MTEKTTKEDTDEPQTERGIDLLSDFEELTEYGQVNSETETKTVGEEEFESWKDLEGVVSVGVTNQRGEVLLLDGCQGWVLPHTGVESSEEDYVEVAKSFVQKVAGIDVEIEEIERIKHHEYRLNENKKTSRHTVVFHATPVDNTTENRSNKNASTDTEWFDSMPENVDRRDDDALNDLRGFFDHKIVDPEKLVNRDDIEFIEMPTSQNKDHFEHYESIDGVAAVGVINEYGEILLKVHESGEHAFLPYGDVESQEDYVEVAKKTVKEIAGIEVDIENPEGVRKKKYTLEEDDSEVTAYNIVLKGSVKGEYDIEDATVGEEWELGWYDSIPEKALESGNEQVIDDIRLITG